jgi:hypothetical protein
MVEVPLIVRVRPMIEVRPSPVRLWPADGGPGGASVLVRVAHAGHAAFEVIGIEVVDPKRLREAGELGEPEDPPVRVTLAEASR